MKKTILFAGMSCLCLSITPVPVEAGSKVLSDAALDTVTAGAVIFELQGSFAEINSSSPGTLLGPLPPPTPPVSQPPSSPPGFDFGGGFLGRLLAGFFGR
jgi:hypothetical protein